MALSSSGYISLGGNVAGRSVAKELNDGAPNFTSTISLNDGNVRSLAQRTGSVSISMSHLRGKSASVDTQTVTVGSYSTGGYIPVTNYGFSNDATPFGSISDGTFNGSGNVAIQRLSYGQGVGVVIFRLVGYRSNSGWTTMTIGSTSFSRTSASFTQGSTTTWTWTTALSNPFGTSGTVTVTWT